MASWAWMCPVNNVARDYIITNFARVQKVGCWEGWVPPAREGRWRSDWEGPLKLSLHLYS